MTVAVVGFPGLGWAETTRGIRTAAASPTFSAVFFIVFLLNLSSPPGAVSQLHIVRVLTITSSEMRDYRSAAA
jgi:hypothetical protein